LLNDKYRIRRAEASDDATQLHALFSDVFHPEDIGTLAETMFHHLPRMKRKYWFIAEEKETSKIVSAFALIPWTWELEGIKLRVAEMGIVGTQEKHRGRGLMRLLNTEFDKTLNDEKFDLAVIQGIPGFYHQFGYYYAIPLENHINMPLHLIPEKEEKDN
jgi:predicted N-acetyltransferase YhbS